MKDSVKDQTAWSQPDAHFYTNPRAFQTSIITIDLLLGHSRFNSGKQAISISLV